MKKASLSLLVCIGLLFAACSKDADTASTNISFQLKTWTSPVINQLIVWNLGKVRVAEAKIQAYRSANNQIEFRTAVDSNLNLFNPTKPANLDIPSGYYQRLEFKTVLVQYLTYPALHLEGVYAATPVVLEANTATEITAVKDTVNIDAIPYTATTKLDLSLLTTGITAAEMDGAARTGGVIIISAFSNPGIYSKMMMNLAASTSVDLAH